MVSSEVQRTLVKSPPELWAEISDPESLARHLGEFGEIRITRVKPEQKVEWEAAEARGSVVIKPSGWGTKVKLTVTRELPPPGEPSEQTDVAPDATAADANSEPSAELEAAEPEGLGESQGESQGEGESETQLEAETVPARHPLDALLDDAPPSAEVESDVAEPDVERAAIDEPEQEPEQRRGFFARLFNRRHNRRPAPREAFKAAARITARDALAEPSTGDEGVADRAGGGAASRAVPPDELVTTPAQASSEAAPSPEPAIVHEREPSPDATPAAEHDAEPAAQQEPTGQAAVTDGERAAANLAKERSADIAAEIRLAEEVAAEQVTTVLTGVLDRLGAAHHRPFSRS